MDFNGFAWSLHGFQWIGTDVAWISMDLHGCCMDFNGLAWMLHGCCSVCDRHWSCLLGTETACPLTAQGRRPAYRKPLAVAHGVVALTLGAQVDDLPFVPVLNLLLLGAPDHISTQACAHHA